MTSPRHKTYLDAARDSILDVGWKRTTLTDVARRSGVSRMTIYRAWPDMETLLADLMTREWVEVITAAVDIPDDEPTPARIATGMASVIGALQRNPLLRRLLDVDPELLLPYLLERKGRSQQAVLDLLIPRIAAGQAAGLIRPGDPALITRTLVLAAHGLTLSIHTMSDDTIDEADLTADFIAFVERGLAP